MMNAILLFLGLYLLSLRRRILFDAKQKVVTFKKRSLLGSLSFRVPFDEVAQVCVSPDIVHLAVGVVGGKDAGYPVPALRLALQGGGTVLVERGKRHLVEELGRKISRALDSPLTLAGP
jgi:hypothetical protein